MIDLDSKAPTGTLSPLHHRDQHKRQTGDGFAKMQKLKDEGEMRRAQPVRYRFA
jgi:hypothetical protein